MSSTFNSIKKIKSKLEENKAALEVKENELRFYNYNNELIGSVCQGSRNGQVIMAFKLDAGWLKDNVSLSVQTLEEIVQFIKSHEGK